jgi:hypothetical protein
MAYLERDLATGEQVAIKYIPRGATVRFGARWLGSRRSRQNPGGAAARAKCTALTRGAASDQPKRAA